MEELKLWKDDPYLEPHKRVIWERYQSSVISIMDYAGYGGRLCDKANAHLYFGCHRDGNGYIFREYLPNAKKVYVVGEFSDWKPQEEFCMRMQDGWVWELRIGSGLISHGSLFKLYVEWEGNSGERIPAYARRVVQDRDTNIFSAQVWDPEPYRWRVGHIPVGESPLIYEAHIGMSSEESIVAGYSYFTKSVLPRIAELGYNVLQLMAIQEHPYYGSFGYQVSSFFAPSSRFGTPEELKELIDEAHSKGISVILDIVHSHSVSNIDEGLAGLDMDSGLYFHPSPKGDHPAWGSKCFDYSKGAVRNLLLSNCKYWMEEFMFDGFRFDGITSMIYNDHGLGRDFGDYSTYFDGNQDVDALIYLTMANSLIHEVYPQAVTIAEDVSGMPGLAAPFGSGGIGFDFRMSMGVSDHWIKWIKELRDEQWDVGNIFYELTNKRADEKTVSYAECHDQAMVGDKTIIFRLADKEMYTHMSRSSQSLVVDRAIALHKMIRLVTAATAGNGYLNFMGNEFGHPEWIDFPREGNGWSYYYARRQWSLSENNLLRYPFMLAFDKAMISIIRDENLYHHAPVSIFNDVEKQLMIFSRAGIIFVFNFSPTDSFTDYKFIAPKGAYKLILDSDDPIFGGFGRVDSSVIHYTIQKADSHYLSLYIPSRSTMVLKMVTE